MHKRNLDTIEQMRMENDQLKTKVNGEFKDEASRKRTRDDVEPDMNIW